ncbi:hypothetical protein ACN4EE_23255 [Geminocystis sp. CENA526]|uniref:hypothetical protein n=1 Tax=Geminocystis sp. CENA526 TaxID=1355871 RepID=UPI003D6FEA84
MSTVTDNDLREIKELISQLSDRMNDRFNELRLNQEKIQTRLEDWKPAIDKIADLSEKVGESKAEGKLGLIAITALISSVLSGTITSLIWFFKDKI